MQGDEAFTNRKSREIIKMIIIDLSVVNNKINTVII